MKRNTKQAIRQSFIVGAVMFGIFIILSVVSVYQDDETFNLSRNMVNEAVRDYEPVVEEYAAEYGVTEHIDVLLAMMMQESGGRGGDPMQSSESYCGSRGCIDDPEASIEQGVYYFSETLEAAGGDVKLAIQSYNFGKGFIDYVNARTGEYSQDAAINFSQTMYEEAANPSQYSCLREEAEQYDACYGDIYYVRDVMAYTDDVANES